MNDDEFTLKPRKIKFKQRLNSTTTYINSTNSVHCMLNEFIVLGSSYLFKPLCVIFCQAFLFWTECQILHFCDELLHI